MLMILRHRGVIARVLRIGAIIVAVAFGGAVPVAAEGLYDSGAYTKCAYSSACDSNTFTPISGQLPSGLHFSVNVANNLTIPNGVYTLIVTPLDGRGDKLTKADIYLDGSLVASPAADQTGTVYWNWDTRKNPAETLRVVVYDAFGFISTPVIRLLIAAANLNSVNSLDASANLVQRIVRDLPPAVNYGVPWLLLALLLATIFIMSKQLQREVGESRRLRSFLDSEHAISGEKDTFVEIASHYLRTPLTLVVGGRDLARAGISPQPAVAGLHKEITRLSQDVEALLSHITARVESAAPVSASTLTKQQIWLRPSLWAPLLAVGGLIAVFNAVLLSADVPSPLANVLLQAAAFAVLAAVLYSVVRRRTLKQRELRDLHTTQAQQQALDDSRNQLIRDAVTQLSQTVDGLADMAAKIPAGLAVQTIQNGLQRFRSMLHTFAIAETIRTGRFSDHLSQADLAALVSQAVDAQSVDIQAKHLRVSPPQSNTVFTCRDQPLLKYVLASLVANAVDYAPDGGDVQVQATPATEQLSVSVSDTGPGLSSQQMSQLFQPFFRAEGALDFSHEGMGFSLYLDRLIVHFLGGEMSASQNKPHGLTITFTLPR